MTEPTETETTETPAAGLSGTEPNYEPRAEDYAALEHQLEAEDAQAEMFPRSYVEQLRHESAEHRTRAQRADELSARLMAATVATATAGILTDPTDLATSSDELLDEDGYPDPQRIATAARELVARKPHLADRRPTGDIGQGATVTPAPVSLSGLLRSRAG